MSAEDPLADEEKKQVAGAPIFGPIGHFGGVPSGWGGNGHIFASISKAHSLPAFKQVAIYCLSEGPLSPLPDSENVRRVGLTDFYCRSTGTDESGERRYGVTVLVWRFEGPFGRQIQTYYKRDL